MNYNKRLQPPVHKASGIEAASFYKAIAGMKDTVEWQARTPNVLFL